MNYQPIADAGLVQGAANQAVIEALHREVWPTGRVAVIGPLGAGKSVLARQLIAAGAAALGTANESAKLMSGHNAPCLVLDNFDEFIGEAGAEEAFFHLLNRTAETGQKVAIFSLVPLPELEIDLPDLRSRLSTFESFEIGEPDDVMMRQLIGKGFQARGVLVAPDAIEYLSRRLERSYEAVEKAVAALDHLALKEGGKVNKARMRQYLDAQADLADQNS